MNQCLINVVERTVFIAFIEVVGNGSIEICKLSGDDFPKYTLELVNTNFENLTADFTKGKYRFEVTMDGHQLTKIININ